MITIQYRPNYYIHSTYEKEPCLVMFSPSGYGYDWIKQCKSLQAAKIAITKHMKEQSK